VEKAVAARRQGQAWIDIAHGCGFTDQSHLIHDFQAIVGAPPEEIFRPPVLRMWRTGNALQTRAFFNLFVG
jgi:AraC-like DNA-binding protein